MRVCARIGILIAVIFPAAAALSAAPAVSPFGLSLPGRLAPQTKARLLKETFRVTYYRPDTVFLDRFARNPSSMADADLAAAAGLKLVLVVRAGEQAHVPTALPTDMERYRRLLGQVLDRYRGAVALLVVENEPDQPRSWKGTGMQYLEMLKAACAVAQARGVKVAAGGLSSNGVIGLLLDHYLSTDQPRRALSLARRARGMDGVDEGQLREALARHEADLVKARTLIAGFKAAGADYLNFHWHESDPGALDEAVAFLRGAGGLPLVTTEIGQRNDDPRETAEKLSRIRQLGLPLAVWYAADSPHSYSLVNGDGSLRPTGEVFRGESTRGAE